MHLHEYINLISEGNWLLLLKNLVSPMLIGAYLTAIGLAVLSLQPEDALIGSML